MRKECGNIYLDIDVTTGSEVSGIRDGTATCAPLYKSETGKACFCVCPHTTRLETGEVKECGGGKYQESGDDGDRVGYSNGNRNKICT